MNLQPLSRAVLRVINFNNEIKIDFKNKVDFFV